MSELDRSVRDYLAQVASPTPSATGGNVGAITVAAAAGLVAMTARVSPAVQFGLYIWIGYYRFPPPLFLGVYLVSGGCVA